MKRPLIGLVLLIILSGCATRWVVVEGPFRMEPQGFAVNVPAGWRRAAFVEDALVLTRDGLLLQFVLIGRVRFAKGMSPTDGAKVELDDVRSNPEVRNLELLENVSLPVADLPGFKLVYTFSTSTGLPVKCVHYGVVSQGWVYRIQYQAAARYYFDKDLEMFERVRESFRVTDKGS